MSRRKSRRIKKWNKPKDQEERELQMAAQTDLAELEKTYGKRGVPDLNEKLNAITDDKQTVLTLVHPTKEDVIDRAVEKAKDKGERKVAMVRDHGLEYPDLWLQIYVAGSKYEEAQFAQMFSRAGCKKADTPDDSDLVIFTGGVDVDPALYGELPHPRSSWSPQRDTADINLYIECLDKGIPMLGICRGAQFLHVMNGGKLYQDIDNHTGDHTIYDVRRRRILTKVSSIHHQACIDNTEGGMEILAVCSKSNERWRNPSMKEVGKKKDIEAFFYRDTCALGIQGHPEYSNYNEFTKWTLELIDEFVVMNSDTDWFDSVRRIKPEILAERKGKLIESITKLPVVTAETN